MSIKGKSFIGVEDLSDQEISSIFNQASVFKKLTKESKPFSDVVNLKTNKVLKSFLVFQEPSTRTRISFEMASHNLGIKPILFSDIKSTSMVKGETLEETLSTLSCFNPEFIVLRYHGSAFPSKKISIPVISAGFGSYEHPTQALIDVFTIQEQRGKIKGQKILIVGDVLHSRVSNSNLKLLKRLGAEVAFCSPTSLFPQDDFWKGVKCFDNLDEGLKWADVIMCLRIQHERHDMSIGLSIAEYRDYYHIGSKQLGLFKSDGIILHPGPYVCGVEIGNEVLGDPRCHILTQVENSPYIRTAVVSVILDFEFKGN